MTTGSPLRITEENDTVVRNGDVYACHPVGLSRAMRKPIRNRMSGPVSTWTCGTHSRRALGRRPAREECGIQSP